MTALAPAVESFFTGYLTATRVRQKGGLVEVRLKIPNREVRAAYRTVFRAWFTRAVGDARRVEDEGGSAE